MFRLKSFLLILALAACESKPVPIPPLENVELFEDWDYAVVAIPDGSPLPTSYLLCGYVDGDQYSFAVDRQSIECAGSHRGLKTFRVNALTPRGYIVRDGLNVDFMRLGPIGTFEGYPEDGAPHIVAARFDPKPIGRVDQYGRAKRVFVWAPIVGKTLAHSIGEGSVHFLGFVEPDGTLSWRDPGNLAEELIRRVGDLSEKRLVVKPPQIIEADCSGDEVRQACSVLSTGG